MFRKLKQFFNYDGSNSEMIHINYNISLELCFIHIPKNSGTSVGKALGFMHTYHTTLIQATDILGSEKFGKCITIAIVRNPWDRFVSLYNYAKLEESYYHSANNPDKALYGKHLDYNLLKDASLKECARFLKEGKLKHDQNWLHWRPQVDWLVDGDGNIGVDYLLRFETLQHDFAEFAKKVGIQERLDKLNQSGKRRHYRELIDDETREILDTYYHEDIKRFGYEF